MLDRCDWGRKGGAILTDLWPPSTYARSCALACAHDCFLSTNILGTCAVVHSLFLTGSMLRIFTSSYSLQVASATLFACEYTFLWNIMGRNLCTGARVAPSCQQSVSSVNFLSQLKKLLDNFSSRQAVRTVSRLIGNGNVQIGNGQIGNVQIGNTQIGSWEMLRLAEWNGPSWPP